ncbi:MAG: EscU/YscU/HrcU family type III secretion system export apparatus switch protein [Bryobacteraceae bacterium]
MSDSSQRTEKATPRRLEKARGEGQFPVSREWVAGVQFVVFVALLSWWGREWLTAMGEMFRLLLGRAFFAEVTPAECQRLLNAVALKVFLPLGAAGGALVASGVGAHFAVTRLGWSTALLAPKFERLNPAARLKELPYQNLTQLWQALLLLPLFAATVWVVAGNHLAAFARLPFQSLPAALHVVSSSIQDLLWKAAAALVAWGAIDWFRKNRRYQAQLRMSHQEVREEMKESEGRPEVKARIRRLRRDLLRRRMMKDVPTATAIIVNPTHYAVAIRYDMDSMAAPLVVAKGKNYLAQRIREIARAHTIPIVENVPLAQALYKSVEVGQEIPAALYKAVAEILAYIFRLTQGRR